MHMHRINEAHRPRSKALAFCLMALATAAAAKMPPLRHLNYLAIEPDPARATAEGNAVILSIPRLRIYTVAELKLDAAPETR